MAIGKESLWKMYFGDPLQCWGSPSRKVGAQYPDVKCEVTKGSFWLDGCATPWFEEELRRRGLKGMGKEGHFELAKDESPFSIVGRLKVCTSMKDLSRGTELHEYIREHKFLEENLYVGSTLVNMYAKCGALTKAQAVLQELPVRNVVAWHALIVGYCHQGQEEQALKCFDDMLCEGYTPTAVTFGCVLKACGSIEAVVKGEEIHEKIASMGMLEEDVVLGTTLVDMYVRCGAVAKAQRVLEELPIRDMVSWSTVITGYAEQGQGEKALKCFDDMLCEGYSPPAITFVSALKACGTIGVAAKGKEIHDRIVSLGMLQKDTMLGNSLVDMYVKCGMLTKAQRVLKELPVRNVVTWNALIAGYAQQGQGQEALNCFDGMLHEGHSPSAFTFACVLQACGGIKAVAKGEEIHDKIVSLGMLENDIVLGTTLVDMYVRCGAVAKAQQVLEELPVRDVVSWGALIAGYAEQGQGEEALKCYDDMLHEGHSPTAVTFACALKACASIGAAAKGEEIHEKIVSLGMTEKDRVLGNSLVDMYVKCDALTRAQQVLKQLIIRDVVSWSALIAGYAQQGKGEEALKCFDDMLHEGHTPTAVTFACVLKACASIGAAALGEEIHDKITSLGMLEKNVVLGNSLVDMYVKCGTLSKAQQVLKELPARDVVTWSALITGYAEQGQGERALESFDDMLLEGHFPNAVTFICILKACGSIGAAAKGKEIHNRIMSLGMLENDIMVRNTLMGMYARCGALPKAQQLLEDFPRQSVVSWNALIAGYAQQGQSLQAINCFERMQSNGVKPNLITLTSVLTACSHSGQLDHAEIYFAGMKIKFGIHPHLEHYCCMTDAFGRARKFRKALAAIAEMPSDICLPSWVALLAACHKWGEVKIGELAFERAVYLDNSNATFYLLMADIYIAAGMHEEACKVDVMRITNKACEKPEDFIVY